MLFQSSLWMSSRHYIPVSEFVLLPINRYTCGLKYVRSHMRKFTGGRAAHHTDWERNRNYEYYAHVYPQAYFILKNVWDRNKSCCFFFSRKFFFSQCPHEYSESSKFCSLLFTLHLTLAKWLMIGASELEFWRSNLDNTSLQEFSGIFLFKNDNHNIASMLEDDVWSNFECACASDLSNGSWRMNAMFMVNILISYRFFTFETMGSVF